MKILILTCSFGNGHHSAAIALKEQIKHTISDSTISVCDLIAMTYPKSSKNIYRAYSFFTREMQPLYNMAANQNIRRKGPWSFLQRSCESTLLKELIECIDKEKPDLIISTYSLTSRLLAKYKRLTLSSIPFVSCITDLQIHSGWVHPETDLYLVASQKTREDLLSVGTSSEKILVTGIPVSPLFFSEQANKEPSQRLLVMGGGLGLLPKDIEFYRRLAKMSNVKTTIICGRNERLYQRLLKENLPSVKILGFTEDIPKRLRESDALLTKAGGVAIFEAIESTVPLLLFPPFMKQEEYNYQFIINEKMGFSLTEAGAKCVQEIENIMNRPEALGYCKHQMRKIKKSLSPESFHQYLKKRTYIS